MAKEYIWMSETGNKFVEWIYLAEDEKGGLHFRKHKLTFTRCWECEYLSSYCLPLRECPHVGNLVNTGVRLT